MRLLVFPVLLLSLFLASCTDDASLEARTEKLEAFSITLPEGWQTNVPDGMQCTRGRCVAGFTRAASGHREALTVSVVPSLGKSLQEIAAESSAGLSSHDASMKIVRQDDRVVEYQGTIKDADARLLAVLDPERQEVGILLTVGGDAGMNDIVRSIVMANPKLDFAAAH